MLNFDCIIIGAGVAGMTSALYLKRANLKILLLEKETFGGQINQTPNIENYPGIESISGLDLATKMFNQIKKLGIDYEYGNVLSITDKEKYKIVKTDINEYTCKYVIIATGRKPKKLGLYNENNLIGHGVSYCALCDGYFYKDKVVAVIGGGNSALGESIYLSTICKKVYLIHHKDKFKNNVEATYIEKIEHTPNIEILYNREITELIQKNNVLFQIKTNNEILNVDGIFVYIGFSPNTEFLKDSNINTKNGYIVVDTNNKTNINNIYACGDVCLKSVFQIVTATSDAVIAANSIINEE